MATEAIQTAGVPAGERANSSGQWALAWARFRTDRAAVAGLVVFLAMLFLAAVGPIVSPPLLQVPDVTHAYLAPSLSLARPWDLFGTDGFGNTILSYVVIGARATLLIGVGGAALAVVIGVVIGGIAGYIGGMVDALLMRVVDLLLAVPLLPLLIILSIYTIPGELTVGRFIFLFGLVGWAGVARLMRAYTLVLREQEYTTAARALGASMPRVVFRHILPGAVDIMAVSFTLNIAIFIVTEASLEFFAITPGEVTWGRPIALSFYSSGIELGYWWEFAFPGAALLLTVLAVNFLGDGLRDALDPAGAGEYIRPLKPRRRWPIVARIGESIAGGVRGIVRPVMRTGTQLAQAHTRADRDGATVPTEPWWSVPPRPRTGEGAGGEGTPVARTVSTSARLDLLRWLPGLPWPLRIAPPLLALVAAAMAFLLGGSRLMYAPNYSPPRAYTVAGEDTPYGAVLRRGGGWNLLLVDPSNRLAYFRVSPSGRTLGRTVISAGNGAREAALGGDGKTEIGAWVTANGSRVDAALIHRGKVHTLGSLNPSGGVAAGPRVIPLHNDSFDVLFSWQPANGNRSRLTLATVRPGSRHIPLRFLTPDNVDASFARAAVDGSGALDVLWLRQRSAHSGAVSAEFRRFTAFGAPLGPARTIATGTFSVQTGTAYIGAAPTAWGLALAPASDGSVWAIAQAGDYQMVDGVQGARRSSLWLARWDEHGKSLLPPTLVDSSASPLLAPFAAATSGQDLHVYFPYPPNTLLLHAPNGQPSLTAGQSGSNAPLIDETFDRRGVASRFERVNFDSGGDAASPEAGIRGGRLQILWEKVTANGAIVEGAAYHHAQPPNFATRLGLNIGSLWGNLLFIVVGGLGFGVVITAANALLLGILIALWLPAGRLPRLLRWPVYVAAVAAVLAWAFVLQPTPPSWIVVISALGARSGWFGDTLAGAVAVAAAIFVSGWLSRAFWSRQDDLVRAGLTAISTVYVIAVLAAVTIVQAQLQQT